MSQHLTAWIEKSTVARARQQGVKTIREPKSNLVLALGVNRETYYATYKKDGRASRIRIGHYAAKPGRNRASDYIEISEARRRASVVRETDRQGGDVAATVARMLRPEEFMEVVAPQFRWADAVESYIAHCASREHGARFLKTKRGYLLNAFAADLEVASITQDDVRRVRNTIERDGYLKKAHDTLCAVRQLFEFLMEHPEAAPVSIEVNPALGVKSEYDPKSPKTDTNALIPLDELRKYIKELRKSKNRAAKLMLFLFATNYRNESALEIQLDWIRYEHRKDGRYAIIEIPRSHQQRGNKRMISLPLPPPGAELIAEIIPMRPDRMTDNPYLFTPLRGDTKSKLAENALYQHLQTHTKDKKSGPYGVRSVRQCFATHLKRDKAVKAHMHQLLMSHASDRDISDAFYNQEAEADIIEDKITALKAWYELIGLK